MPEIGLLLHLIERQSLDDNWEAVLPLLDRLEPLVKPEDPDATRFSLYHRGYALLELNRPSEAAESLERLIDLDEVNPHYRLLMADAMIRAEEWPDALLHLESGLACEPDHPGCLCAMGWTLYQMGRRDEGLSVLEHALEVHPQYHPAHLDLGLVHAAEGNWKSSEAHLLCALDAAPEDIEIREVLEAVRESRARAEAERIHIRHLWPEIRRRREGLPAVEVELLRMLRKGLRLRGASHLEVLLAENLWIDFAATQQEHPFLDPAWASAVCYAMHRLQGRPVRRADLALDWGVGTSTLGRRYRRLRLALDLRDGDPRYLADVQALEASFVALERSLPGKPARDSRPVIIPVDFVEKRRLPQSVPCPCGSGLPVHDCAHTTGIGH